MYDCTKGKYHFRGAAAHLVVVFWLKEHCIEKKTKQTRSEILCPIKASFKSCLLFMSHTHSRNSGSVTSNAHTSRATVWTFHISRTANTRIPIALLHEINTKCIKPKLVLDDNKINELSSGIAPTNHRLSNTVSFLVGEKLIDFYKQANYLCAEFCCEAAVWMQSSVSHCCFIVPNKFENISRKCSIFCCSFFSFCLW